MDDSSLADRIGAIESRLASEMQRIENEFALKEQIASLEDKTVLFDRLRESDFKNFEKQIPLYTTLVKEAEAHHQETRRDIFKIVTIGGAVAFAFTLIGVQTVKSYLQNAVTAQSEKISRVLDPLLTFQYNYVRGAGLLARKDSKDAMLEAIEGTRAR